MSAPVILALMSVCFLTFGYLGVPVPFALFGHTAFLAERVLGNVISAGIKLMVLAIVVGIGATLFGTLIRPTGEITLTQAASTILAAIAVFGLAVFVPAIAPGLV